MSELDLGLKVGVRALLWSMGFSTRLDVQLRGHERPTGGPAESFTDLDVLGVAVAPGYRLSTTIADCKSGRADKPTARMFWIRGVADLFGADDAMLVREHDVNDATRQLSAKLGITVLPSVDLQQMQELHGVKPGDELGHLSILFDKDAAEAHLRAFTKLDKRLKPLIEYRDFDYWVYDHHRNPFQLVAHLHDAARHLKPRDPDHLALFFDLAWLYLLALIRVTEHVRGAFLTDPDRGLQEYLFGGPTGLKEKTQMAKLLQSLRPEGARERDHLPDYYPPLRELVIRLLRRPAQMQAALRQAEAASALCAARQRVTVEAAFGEEFDPLAAKLVSDVCGFLVGAADLDGEFRVQARAFFLGEPVQGAQRQSKGVAARRSKSSTAPVVASQEEPELVEQTSPPPDGSPVGDTATATDTDPDADADADAAADAAVAAAAAADVDETSGAGATDDARTVVAKGSEGADAEPGKRAAANEEQPSLDL